MARLRSPAAADLVVTPEKTGSRSGALFCPPPPRAVEASRACPRAGAGTFRQATDDVGLNWSASEAPSEDTTRRDSTRDAAVVNLPILNSHLESIRFRATTLLGSDLNAPVSVKLLLRRGSAARQAQCYARGKRTCDDPHRRCSCCVGRPVFDPNRRANITEHLSESSCTPDQFRFFRIARRARKSSSVAAFQLPSCGPPTPLQA